MRNYYNMPRLNWDEKHSVGKAKNQIRHQEPVILNMPMDFVMDIEADQYHCKYDDRTGVLYDCSPNMLLDRLAEINQSPGLREIGEICSVTSSRVDLDQEKKWIIIHD